MIKLDFNKTIDCPWGLVKIQKVFNQIERVTKAKGSVEVSIVGDKEIKDLNFRYRGLKKVTDVLSFAWQEDKIIKTDSLGQIYICYPQIVRQAKTFSVKPEEEFVRMLAHGFLHILGHDHGKKKEAEIMFGLQEDVVDKYFKK